MRTCTKCKIEKEIVCFGIDNTKVDGLRPDCKQCRSLRTKPKLTLDEIKEKQKEYYLKNKNKVKEYKEINKGKLKAKRDGKKEAKRIYDKEYKLKNKDKVKESNNNYIRNNIEHVKQKRKEYYEKNKEAILQWQVEYKQKKREVSKDFKNPIDDYFNTDGMRLGID